MGSDFDVFDDDGFDAFLTTSHFARGGGTFAVGGGFIAIDGNSVFGNCVFRANEFVPIFEGEDPAVNNTVFVVLEYKSDLYIGGAFTGGIRVLNKETEKFDIVGGGITGSVRDFAVFDGKLIIVGDFNDANGVANTHKVAAWDGDTFLTMFSAPATPARNFAGNPIIGVTVSNNKLFVCGAYNFLVGLTAKGQVVGEFTGAGWIPVATDPPFGRFYREIIHYAGELWGCGAAFVQKVNGPDAGAGQMIGISEAMAVIGGALYIGGSITEIEGDAMLGVSKFTAATGWLPIGDGFDDFNSVPVELHTIFSFDGEIYIGGEFAKTIDGDLFVNIIKFDKKNDKWVRASIGLGTNTGTVHDMADFSD